MIEIDKLHDYIRGVLKKNYGGFVSPKDIDRAINRASMDLFSQLLKRSNVDDEFDFDHLFLKKGDLSLAVVDSGKKDLPPDYEKAVTFHYKDSSSNLHEGDLVEFKKFSDQINSVIVPPVINDALSSYRAIATIYDGQIEFAPKPTSTDYNFVLIYYRTPAQGTYGYTESNGVITFDAGASTNLDWSERAFSDIANRALSILGFTMQDQMAAQIEQTMDGTQNRTQF